MRQCLSWFEKASINESDGLALKTIAHYICANKYPSSVYPNPESGVMIESEDGFGVSVPGLPGCWSEGKTEKEALVNIADAIKDYLAVAEILAKEDQGQIREVEVVI